MGRTAVFIARIGVLLCGLCLFATASAERVTIQTSLGDFEVLLFDEQSPISVSNFLSYVDVGAYNDTIFHRVIPAFMVQGGGHYEDLSDATEKDPIRNEADNGLLNERGTLAMARFEAIDSARRQFFINLDHNTHLDHGSDSCTRQDEEEVAAAREKGLFKPRTCKNFGYAVFGRVVKGMDVVDRIASTETTSEQGFHDLPTSPIIIKSITRGDGE